MDLRGSSSDDFDEKAATYWVLVLVAASCDSSA